MYTPTLPSHTWPLGAMKNQQPYFFFFKEWRVALTFKLSYYLSIAYYCCGLIAEENKKRGESVCYYTTAVERLKDSWKNAEKISTDKTSIYKDAYTFAHDVIMEK
jgi:hypothetical protein